MTPQTPNAQRQPRLEALDAMRGATVAAMLLVNNPGTWSSIYSPLCHAEWHGWTPTDLIFPFFLFIVGITTELSRKEPWGILKRGTLIILCGLLLNLFPYFRFGTLRWFGVLQRIGIVYIVAALIAYKVSRRTIVLITAVILLGYWAVLAQGPLEPPEATIAAQVDRALIPAAHIWKQSKTWDPEGPLSTVPAVATALLGILAARWVKAKNVNMLIISGLIAIVVGLAWGELFPINKNLWTSSYVVFTAGCAALLLGIWIRFFPAHPFIAFGTNPLVAFVGSGMMARLLGISGWQKRSYAFFDQPFLAPQLSSLLWALAFVAVWYLILLLLYRRRIFLRV